MYEINLTPQEAKARILEHFSQDGAQLSRANAYAKPHAGGNGCYYRGPNGSKCAVGCLIPDSVYRPEMENNTLESLREAGLLVVSNEQTESFLEDAQSLHDGAGSVESFLKELEKMDLNVY